MSTPAEIWQQLGLTGVDHYENFPVASILMPKAQRWPVQVIYRFARSADDFADEGQRLPEQRMALLNAYSEELDNITAGQAPRTELFRDVARIIHEHALPIQLFHDLLDAFKQDVHKTRYATFGEVMDYCRRSANPVGRLLLHLFKQTDARQLAQSDGICSALQLINHWQDIAVDWRKGRMYLPQEDLDRFGVSEAQIAAQDTRGGWHALMRFEVERARKMLEAGAPLALNLPGRFGLEIRLTVAGGATILKKLHNNPDIFRHRPTLKHHDWPQMLWRALLKR